MTETLFRWDESFLIGIDELDHEHKQLIDDINRLHEELAGNQKSEVRKWLGEVCARMQAHFALEEHVMKEHDYEFFDEHKREHDEMNCSIIALSTCCNTSMTPAPPPVVPLRRRSSTGC